MLLAAAAIAGVAVYKHKKRKWRRSKMNNDHGGQTLVTHAQNVSDLQQLPHSNQTDDPDVLKRITFVNLIEGVYQRAKSKPDSHCKPFWESSHYELVPLQQILRKEELEPYQRCIVKEEKNQYFGVFRKNTLCSPAAPEWVIAIRGTLILRMHDIVNNLKISVESLHTSSTVRLLKVVISRLIEKMGLLHPKGSKPAGTVKDLSRSLAVTGHSLGAAKAMLVAREFALRGYLLDSHFFNPPFATLAALARYGARKIFSPIFGRRQRKAFRIVRMGISVAFNFWQDGGSRMMKQYAEYKALTKWSPYLYLHEKDPICGLYISHFSTTKAQLDSWYSCGSALLRAAFGDAQTFHLMPRAVCCIALTKPVSESAHSLDNWTSTLSAHSLDNWTRHDVAIKVVPANNDDDDDEEEEEEEDDDEEEEEEEEEEDE